MDTLKLYSQDFPQFIKEFAETDAMKRLRNVGMNCGCEYTSFPLFKKCQPYSRYDHSIGVALIVWHFTHDIKQSLAGLFHDISTPVFAHVVDFLNNDHLKQESTEAKTAEIIAGSSEIQTLLKKYGLKTEDVADYHIYPIADNDSPRLSADRLEYTLGVFYTYGLRTLKEIKTYYDDLVVGKNEDGIDEIMFAHQEIAEEFTKAALVNSRTYIADEDRFAMQALSDLLKNAIQEKVVEAKDLYTTEPQLIEKFMANEKTRMWWNTFRKYSALRKSSIKPNDGYWIKIHAKKRVIDPYVISKGRLSSLSFTAKAAITEFKNISFDVWLSAE